MRLRGAAAVALLSAAVAFTAAPASAQEGCSRAVIFTLPTVTWEEVMAVQPPTLLELAAHGAVGSMSVRTNASVTTYASGFATIGAGTRVDVPLGSSQPYGAQHAGLQPVTVPGVEAIDELAAEEGYSVAQPGAFGEAVANEARTAAGGIAAIGNADVGAPPPRPFGFARYTALAAMDASGEVALAATGSDLLSPSTGSPYRVRTDDEVIRRYVDEVLNDPCAVAVIDHGDLIRADQLSAAAVNPALHADDRREALLAADDLLAEVIEALDPARDLLVVAAPASPRWDRDIHFGVAVVHGPGFAAGSSLISPSTRRHGIVTLPDIAPTVLKHLGIPRPTSMLGRAFAAEPASSVEARVADAVDLDREAVFIDRVRTPVSTGFVLFQLLVYAAAVLVLTRSMRSRGRGRSRGGTALQSAALLLAAFPLATYLAGLIQGYRIGALAYGALLIGVAVVVVVAVNLAVRAPLDRLLVVVGSTFASLIVDLVLGAPLQLNTVFSYSPIVAGRFAGIGNIGFAILSATSLLTGALIVHRWGATTRSLTFVGAIFALTVVVDGAPQFGSDVGGAIALVPGLGIAWLLLAGKRPTWRALVAAAAGGVVVLALFLALDLSRPEESRTHLARLFEDVRSGGGSVFADAIMRKIRTNLRVLGSTIWTFLVPPALMLLAWLLLRPRWQWLSRTYPKVRAGLLGGLVMAVLGYAVNDSGIVIPAMMFSYLVPVAVAPLSETAGNAHEGTAA
ncbi:MAG: hypothetical protein M3N53_06990 [Actinomycetota bacterium]|nr:hypothetical protein [Actinomycetota bacterium]